MLPDFCEEEVWPYDEELPYKILPPGIHHCSSSDLRARFVVAAPNSSTRSEIHQGFRALLREAQDVNVLLTHWLGGSFISSKADPEDIDACVFVDNSLLSAANVSQKHFLHRITNQRGRIHDKYLTDQILVVIFDESHPMFSVYTDACAYWQEHYGYTREQRDASKPNDATARLPRAPRGIVYLNRGAADASTSISFEEVSPDEDGQTQQ